MNIFSPHLFSSLWLFGQDGHPSVVVLVLQRAGKRSEAIAILEGQVDGGVSQEVSSTGGVVGGDGNVDGGTPVSVLLDSK